MKTQDEKSSWLQHFPIMFYTVVMGLGGLALAYERLKKLDLAPFEPEFELGETAPQ